MRFKDYLTESVLKSYIKSMLLLLSKSDNPHPFQVKYWKWQQKQGKPVKVVSYASDPKLKALIDKELKLNSPKIKECYRNSFMIALGQNDIGIVVGYTAALGAVPIEHAWNFYKPKKIYFDLTLELCLNKKVEREIYLKILDVDAKKAMPILTSNHFSIMGFLGAWFRMTNEEVAKPFGTSPIDATVMSGSTRNLLKPIGRYISHDVKKKCVDGLKWDRKQGRCVKK